MVEVCSEYRNLKGLTGLALGAGWGPVRGEVAPAKGRLQKRVWPLAHVRQCTRLGPAQ